jgi:hypothetical protein
MFRKRIDELRLGMVSGVHVICYVYLAMSGCSNYQLCSGGQPAFLSYCQMLTVIMHVLRRNHE